MKIILSPSKTMVFDQVTNLEYQEPTFITESNLIVQVLKKLSKEDLSQVLKIKGNTLDKTYMYYENFGRTDSQNNPSILTYKGEVFKQLNLSTYNSEEFTYLQNHLVILSALYGIVRPFDFIEAYRLDMTKPLPTIGNLYRYWSNKLTEILRGETLVNLASKEYRKLIKLPMIDIHFLQIKDGNPKNVAIHSKKARGLMLNYMTKHSITEINDMKSFNLDNYQYSKELSSEDNITFTRISCY